MGFQGDFHIIGTIQCGCLLELGGVFFAGFNPQRAKVKSNFSEWLRSTLVDEIRGFIQHIYRWRLRGPEAASKVCGSVGNKQWKIGNSESFFGYLIQTLNMKRNRYRRSLSSCLSFMVETRVSCRFSVKPNYFQYSLGISLADLELSQ